MTMPKIPVGDFFEAVIDFLITRFSIVTRTISRTMKAAISDIVDFFSWFNPLFLIVVVSLLVWRIVGKKGALITFFGLLYLWNQQLWLPTLETFVLVLIATLLAVIIGLPLGIWTDLSDLCFRIMAPILDFMQTMPAFVYLIPAIAFFGLGSVSAIFSTLIFAIPPVIRLTGLGLREIPKELMEAADSFGTTKMQKLLKVQLPLAKPTIMAGIQQAIMLSLSMVVIAAMIGAGGLGAEVWRAIQRLDMALGFEAGIGVVVCALILDSWTHQLIYKKGA